MPIQPASGSLSNTGTTSRFVENVMLNVMTYTCDIHIQLRVYIWSCHAYIFIFDETKEHGFESPASQCSDLETATIFTISEHRS